MRASVPTQFTAGESLAWKKSFSDYPASEGWILSYSFRGAGAGFDAAASAEEDDFLTNVAASVTDTMTAGSYFFQAFVEKDSEKILVDSGEIQVLPGLAATGENTVFDGRSQTKKTLDAIDALLAGKATLDQQEYTIGNRQLKRYSITELIALRREFQNLYNQELRAENSKKGSGAFKNHYVRFRNPR